MKSWRTYLSRWYGCLCGLAYALLLTPVVLLLINIIIVARIMRAVVYALTGAEDLCYETLFDVEKDWLDYYLSNK